MPEESINIFISNIYSIAAFAAVFLFVFIFLFFLSRILIYKFRVKKYRTVDNGNLTFSKEKLRIPAAKNETEEKKISEPGFFNLRKDLNIIKDLFVIGVIFISTIFFILLMMLSFYLVTNIQEGNGLYLVLTIVFLILIFVVYTIKSKIINK